ncbi:NUDIX hydrolase [Aureimonas phyllosphaerae]|uniref:ADP-ribose pyrophosphatase YjhB (NUDIX family) n=1 Tax=Aureimonas phyllosphaerae TaxID=1166078 RepID=A0A7W6BSU1_9HYPH|nr:NUDIX hydrolase [Aureimonas phyllosphaerae]MBB3934045.1 ADP-ribose pyrophosphatase YjhB (NUDIX family) [Aureimonas phyllosphaerae]MBB3958739.1 ADP-ribose pyrophosphatase YjhB (NUDIX family) [Aureimonas phyllosphaerae]SFF18619.1 ADP-ribose pyrophosphatase YjhB, NUDIX family [Aureimonas phyllosphaerae]
MTLDRAFSVRVPEGDAMPRKVCDHCGFVAYENPKIVVGSVVRSEGRILLCRRAIEPRRGYWTIPAGYMELNETPEEGAMREAREEAGASIAIERLLAIYSVPRISQVQLIFRAELSDPAVEAGVETLELRFFAWDEIPWDDLAFPSVHWALNHERAAEGGAPPVPFGNPEGAAGDRMPDGRPLPVGDF